MKQLKSNNIGSCKTKPWKTAATRQMQYVTVVEDGLPCRALETCPQLEVFSHYLNNCLVAEINFSFCCLLNNDCFFSNNCKKKRLLHGFLSPHRQLLLKRESYQLKSSRLYITADLHIVSFVLPPLIIDNFVGWEAVVAKEEKMRREAKERSTDCSPPRCLSKCSCCYLLKT